MTLHAGVASAASQVGGAVAIADGQSSHTTNGQGGDLSIGGVTARKVATSALTP
jgi:hypothetical protein